MALTAVQPAMDHEKAQNVHPFFSKPLHNHGPLAVISSDHPATNDPNDNHDSDYAPNAQPARARKKRVRKSVDVKENIDGSTRSQTSLEQFTRSVGNKPDFLATANDAVDTILEEDVDTDRMKRQKTTSPGSVHDLTNGLPNLNRQERVQIEAQPVDEGITQTIATTQPEDESTKEVQAGVVTPKKQIQVTKSGKLVSSPPKPIAEPSSPPKRKRGRPPAKIQSPPTVTIIKYGSDTDSRKSLGEKIDAILNSKKPITKRSTSTKKGPAKPPQPRKVTHPFFVGKPAPKVDDSQAKPSANAHPSTPRKTAVTPGKLLAEAHRDRSPPPVPSFGSLGRSRAPKHSGQHDAIDEEDIISRLAKDVAGLISTQRRQVQLDFSPPGDVRLPTRLLTTGHEIQQRVCEQLQAKNLLPHERSSNHNAAHPAVTSLFADIEHILTPFDQGRCEAQTWVQKYSPKCAAHVLNAGSEAEVLKDWLQSLTVMAVGGAQTAIKVDPADAKRPPKKKRKKDFDDFIVSDDEDDGEDMVPIPEKGDAVHTTSYRIPRWTRNKNVVVISGPHGCGKSATIYAVAKELDFEVFEINSGTRRSGKDIQDKVGDMTGNHLVNHKRAEASTKQEQPNIGDDEGEQDDTAMQKDIDSGRQGTMTAFFKARPTTKVGSKENSKTQAAQVHTKPKAAAQATLTNLESQSKSQKQSLILFEEADILFEEDQQFWVQVAKLAAHSKRPIVITCNDERQIPLQDLPLAAVLRLDQPPIDLATDYLLVLAGREGHVIDRHAVSNLYKAKGYDLRSSITELNFWCQMSVGDKKGGLEWLYQRWPPGKDVDTQGRLLRVASEGTYQSGMGWLSHNLFESGSNAAFDKEEELLNQLWVDWDVSPADWEMSASPINLSDQPSDLISLERVDAFADALSAADVFCRVGLPSYEPHDEPADPTLPPIFGKSRLSYTLSAPLLQADHKSDFLQLDTSIYTHTHLLAHRAFPVSAHSSSTCPRIITEDDYAQGILEIKESREQENQLSRPDYSQAFDVIAALPDQTLLERTSFNLTPSSFDRTFNIITLDLAPYVRSIVAHEHVLESQRVRISNLLSVGGTGKRARTTRASRVALEGGVRETKRRDRWFDSELDFGLVMATAGQGWAGMGWRSEEEGNESGSMTGTQESLPGSQDVSVQDIQEEGSIMDTTN
ncbi:hypothetical protein DE146DRAFT_727584 [Phaeosphaeria sp. MPI-PUGE-AT-0046c]|nr:hypothetical protein DE146DRAFT_727584 [Phaeosphaeria sp. MPI-PUGE-AT-0046c]